MDRDDLDWDEVYRLHAPRLRRRLAKRGADPAIVDDVVQETFIQAYRRWPTYDQSRPLWPWLVAIATNRAWRWSQASQRVGAVEGDEGSVEVPLLDYFQAGSDDHVANLHRRRAMRTALDGMTEKHRRILLAWELGDRSVSDLAASEGLSPEELRATVVRARRSLRRRYLAAAGDGPFGWVIVGLGGVVTRWRDRLTRAASTSGWAEAAGSLAAAPVVAVAGMAMITLVPAPASHAPPPSTIAEKPATVAQTMPIVPEPAEPVQLGSTPIAIPSSPTESVSTPPPVARTIAAGPAAANLATTPTEKQAQLNLDGSTGDTEWHYRSETYCESVVAQALCEVRGLIPPTG
jgi:RNA polymerase sigma-70 factor (ECF subfamily)